MSIRVLIVCGGTGGHLAPGIAIAEGLHAKGHQALLCISRKQVDARLSRKYSQLEFRTAPGSPLRWHPLKLARFFVSQVQALFFYWRLIRGWKPDLVMGLGGFLSAGFLVPSLILRKRLIIHEANRVVGRAVRVLSHFADRTYLPPGVRFQAIRRPKIRHVALPLRSEFKEMSRYQARDHLGIEPEGRLLVVLGGSQGAQALNEWAEEHFDQLAELGISVYCLSGPGKLSQGHVRKVLSNGHAADFWTVPFSDDMPSVISSADLVLSRAGAGTLQELVRLKRPAILVPYPYARDLHQDANAAHFEMTGCGMVVKESHKDRLLDEIGRIMASDKLLAQFRQGLMAADREDARSFVINALEDLAGVNRDDHREQVGKAELYVR